MCPGGGVNTVMVCRYVVAFLYLGLKCLTEWPIVFSVTRRGDPFHCRLWICCEPIASGLGESRNQAMQTAANASVAYLKKVLPREERLAHSWIFGCDLEDILYVNAGVFRSARVGVAHIVNDFERLTWVS